MPKWRIIFILKSGASGMDTPLYDFRRNTTRVLYLDLYLNTAGELELHQGVNSLSC